MAFKRGKIYYVDKSWRDIGRIYMSTGTSDKERAQGIDKMLTQLRRSGRNKLLADIVARRIRLADLYDSMNGEFVSAAPALQDFRLPDLIYVLARADGHEIKIGLTRRLDKRITNLQAAHGEPLKLLLTFPGDKNLERRLHRRFASYRKMGEWFLPSAPILEWIEEERKKQATAA